MEEEIKVSKSYSLRPSQVAWLRQQALNESTAAKTVSASAVLERIIDEAIEKEQSNPSKKNAALELVAA